MRMMQNLQNYLTHLGIDSTNFDIIEPREHWHVKLGV